MVVNRRLLLINISFLLLGSFFSSYAVHSITTVKTTEITTVLNYIDRNTLAGWDIDDVIVNGQGGLVEGKKTKKIFDVTKRRAAFVVGITTRYAHSNSLQEKKDFAGVGVTRAQLEGLNIGFSFAKRTVGALPVTLKVLENGHEACVHKGVYYMSAASKVYGILDYFKTTRCDLWPKKVCLLDDDPYEENFKDYRAFFETCDKRFLDSAIGKFKDYEFRLIERVRSHVKKVTFIHYTRIAEEEDKIRKEKDRFKQEQDELIEEATIAYRRYFKPDFIEK